MRHPHPSALSLVLLLSLALGLGVGATARAAPTPVIVTEAVVAPFEDEVEALGTLLANESVTLSSTVSERVTAIHFDDGDRVRAGALLIELNDAELRALLEEAEVLADEARRQYERLRTLQEQNQAAASLVDERRREWETAGARVRSLEARLAEHALRAPFDGVLGLRNVSLGALVSPGDAITTLDDDREMKLEFSVPEVFMADLRPGLAIRATSPALPGRSFEGEIAVLDSRVDPDTRSIRVRARLPNPDHLLRPGLLMKVTLSRNPRQSLRVPEEALIPVAGQHYVLVVESGRASLREVTVGTRRPGEVEIRAGLESGEQVIVEGTSRVKNGDLVRILAVDDGTASLAERLREAGG